MGATTFMITYKGKTADEAFQAVVAQARYMYGNAGYTGSIAEKRDYTVIRPIQPLTDKKAVAEYADRLIADDDPRIRDKWGPAGCIALGNDEWLFFGWASE